MRKIQEILAFVSIRTGVSIQEENLGKMQSKLTCTNVLTITPSHHKLYLKGKKASSCMFQNI